MNYTGLVVLVVVTVAGICSCPNCTLPTVETWKEWLETLLKLTMVLVHLMLMWWVFIQFVLLSMMYTRPLPCCVSVGGIHMQWESHLSIWHCSGTDWVWMWQWSMVWCIGYNRIYSLSKSWSQFLNLHQTRLCTLCISWTIDEEAELSLSPDNVTHCVGESLYLSSHAGSCLCIYISTACHDSCSEGLMGCTGFGPNRCCNYYNNSMCVDECPSSFQPNSSNECVCPPGTTGFNCCESYSMTLYVVEGTMWCIVSRFCHTWNKVLYCIL